MVSMNRLSKDRQAQIVACLVEGNSIRATCRMTGAAKNTVAKLLVDLGRACREYQDGAIQQLTTSRVQVDEIWSFVGSKQKNVPAGKEGEYGDAWTWTAIDADSKLMLSWWVGGHDYLDASILLQDLHSRLSNRVQLSTDGWVAYAAAVEDEFGADVDYAQIIKKFGLDPKAEDKRYSPAVCTGIEIRVKEGDPDPAHISTSYVERSNLTMRMGMRRFTRLTNAFSKKIENLDAAVSLHFMHYNFARPHQTLKQANGYQRTPAMAAGIADHVWKIEEIVALLSDQ
jgi:IS1 family transposase